MEKYEKVTEWLDGIIYKEMSKRPLIISTEAYDFMYLRQKIDAYGKEQSINCGLIDALYNRYQKAIERV